MGDVIELKTPPAHPEDNHEFVVDCCRYREGVLTEKAVKKKYWYSDAVWEALGGNYAPIEAIEEEHVRRYETAAASAKKHSYWLRKRPTS